MATAENPKAKRRTPGGMSGTPGLGSSGAGHKPGGEAGQDDMDTAEYELRKRLPRRLPRRKNDVYVTRKTNFKAQLARCKRLLETGEKEVYIHGLGAAVDRAVNLALQLKTLGAGSLDLAANTTTVELTDDLEPLDDRLEPETQTRNVSAIHIKVFSRVGGALAQPAV